MNRNDLHRQSSRFGAAVLLLLLVTGCGKPDPGPTLEDPRAFAVKTLQTQEIPDWWSPYRNPDPELLGEIVDEVAAKLPDGLPKQQRPLLRVLRNRILGRYKRRMSDTEEGRAYILARAEERFANPPSTTWGPNGRYALLDYQVLPGEWRSTSRLSEGLKFPKAIEKNPYLRPEVLSRSLRRLKEKHPDAKVFQLRYAYHLGSDLKRILMQIVPDRKIVYRMGVNLYFTEANVPWSELLAGRVDLAGLDWGSPMEGVSAPPLARPDKAPLPFEPR